MKLLMISTDRRAFVPESDSRRRLLELAKRLDSLTVIIFSRHSHRLNPLVIENLILIPTNSINRWFYVWSAWRLRRKLSLPEVITAQDPFEAGLTAWSLARYFQVPWQAQIHTSLFAPNFIKESWLNWFRVRLARYLLPRADQVRVVSQEIAKSLEKAQIKLKAPPLVLPVFIDIERLSSQPVSFDLRSRFPHWQKIILMVSRLSREKNFPLAFKSLNLLAKKNKQLGLVIVGDGPERSKLERLVRRGGLMRQVFFAGWSDQLASYFCGADVFLLTSRYEGFNRTLVEALVFGVPAVSTPVGGALETGARIVSPEPQAIAQELEALLVNRPILEPFSWWSQEEYWNKYLAALPRLP